MLLGDYFSPLASAPHLKTKTDDFFNDASNVAHDLLNVIKDTAKGKEINDKFQSDFRSGLIKDVLKVIEEFDLCVNLRNMVL